MSRSEGLTLLAILVVAALLRLPGLLAGLWHDEVMYSWVYFDDPGKRDWLFWGDVHPPVYPVIVWIWSALFGNDEAVLRMPSYLAGMSSLVLTWSLARKQFARGVALLAVAFLAFSPPHIWYSVENKANMLALALSLLAVWLATRAAVTPAAARGWVLTILAMLLALGTHAYAIAVFGALVLWLGWRSRSEPILRERVLAFAAVVIGAWLPLFLWKTLSQGASLARPYLRAFTPAEAYKFLLLWLPHGNAVRSVSPSGPLSQLWRQSWAYFLVDGLCAALLLIGVVSAAKGAHARIETSGSALVPTGRWPHRLLLLWFLVPLVGALVASLTIRRFYIERNLLFLLPPYAILVAAGIVRLQRSISRYLAGATFVALAVIASLFLLVWRHDRWTVYKPKPDWRAAAAFLRSEAQENGRLVLATTTPSLEVDFYLRPNPSGRPAIAVADLCSGKFTLAALVGHGAGSFWLVKNETWEGCWTSAWRQTADSPGIQLRRQRAFPGLALFEFVSK